MHNITRGRRKKLSSKTKLSNDIASCSPNFPETSLEQIAIFQIKEGIICVQLPYSETERKVIPCLYSESKSLS